MAKDWAEIIRRVDSGAAQLSKQSPDVLSAFSSLMSAASKSGALDVKTKELMAVAISISIRCEGCIAYHTKKAIASGASKEEYADTIAVAIEMGGGPAMVYGADAASAYEYFSK